MPATYRSSPIFGFAVKMASPINPVAAQENGFFGVSGIESLYGGQRGRVTQVEGVLAGSDISGLAAAKQTFESYHDGIAGVLTDTSGTAYSNVKLQTIQYKGKIRQLADGTCFQEYQAVFSHMSIF